MNENFLTRKFNNGIEYILEHMTPAMKNMYQDVDYRITYEKMKEVESVMIRGEPVEKQSVDEILRRLTGLIEVTTWFLDPPADKNLQRALQKLNPMRRGILLAKEHAEGIKSMVEYDIKEKFELINNNGQEFYSLKQEHRFSE